MAATGIFFLVDNYQGVQNISIKTAEMHFSSHWDTMKNNILPVEHGNTRNSNSSQGRSEEGDRQLNVDEDINQHNKKDNESHRCNQNLNPKQREKSKGVPTILF